jgi:streptomycin 6-kinase
MAFRSLGLAPGFISHNSEDAAWLEALPVLLERLAVRWSLGVDNHFPDIRLNYVAPATRSDNTACVLKVSRHVDETRNEIAALQLWDGDGAARLLEADPELGALLVERLNPARC